MQDIARLCDHTFLLPTEAYRAMAKKGESAIQLRRRALDAFLQETLALPLRPYAICVHASDIAYLSPLLPEEIRLGAAVGFPDGPRYSTAYKLAETEAALAEGAHEIDMVVNYEALQQKHDSAVLDDILPIAQAVAKAGGVLKVILEVSELDDSSIIRGCHLAQQAGAAFVKTSTGFSSHGATEASLRLMHQHFEGGIKISGGVNQDNVYRLLRAATGNANEIPHDPMKLRIGESSLLQQLCKETV